MTDNDGRAKEQWQLLQTLRTTVEGLLIDKHSNVWDVYGGLNRLHIVIERIFKHGCRIFDANGEPDCWMFIQGLTWLCPSLAISSPLQIDNKDYLENLPPRIIGKKDALWLYESLENHTLSSKLSWLLSDKEHLLYCLEPWAFLCQDNLAEATLICLKAVERNQPELLTEIDPSLFLPNSKSFGEDNSKGHRRSSSFPANFTKRKSDELLTMHLELPKAPSDNKLSSFPENVSDEPDNDKKLTLRTWSSLPSVLVPHDKNDTPIVSTSRRFSETEQDLPTPRIISKFASSKNLSEVIKVNYSELKSPICSMEEAKLNSRVEAKAIIPNKEMKIPPRGKSKERKSSEGSEDTLNYEDSSSVTFDSQRESARSSKIEITNPRSKARRKVFSGSAPEFSGTRLSAELGYKDENTPERSFMEDGGSGVQPMSIGYFPRPVEGQSLTSFLSTARFSRANAVLDRENAHFSISEAMIAAIEQVKCNKELRLLDETVEESDEEINDLKQKIRLRRRQKQEERRKGTWNRDLLSDGRTDTTTTDQSISPMSTSCGSSSESISTDGIEDFDINDRSLAKLRNSGLRLSMASLYSEFDLPRSTRHGTDSNFSDSTMSAEGVALSLISKFSDKQLPKASELEWLVSEQDAPQQLLPLPNSWPISPDETETVPLRGTSEWAPPRPQIIFTPHPPPQRKTLIAKQNYRCAGCGMRVAVKYSKRLRYCHYLGRYFCTGCHANQVALIPGKVLTKWDFTRYYVSSFAYKLLGKMMVDPLFKINYLNPTLYRRVKQLERCKQLRVRLSYLKDFLFNCRFATDIQEIIKEEPEYIHSDPHVYSMQDLMFIKFGDFVEKLQNVVKTCTSHVAQCVLCQARGFVCELCNSEEVIFPWDLQNVVRCDFCGTCSHLKCKTTKNEGKECRKCVRLKTRKSILSAETD